MDRGTWWAAVHGVARSRTQLSDFTFHFHALEKEMTTHSSVLVRRIPGTGKPGGLPSMGSHRVGHDWSDLAAACLHQFVQEWACNLSHANQSKSLHGIPRVIAPRWRAAIHGVVKSRTRLSDWTELKDSTVVFFFFLSWIWLDLPVP